MTPIQELERRCAAGESIVAIAQAIGVTHQNVSARLINARNVRQQDAESLGLQKGDMLREKDTGHRWQYAAPSVHPGCIRVSTDGGAHSMDMRLDQLERVKPSELQPTDDEPRFGVCRRVFSIDRGDDPNDPQFRPYIERAMEVRQLLDEAKNGPHKADPDANLRATTQRKADERRKPHSFATQMLIDKTAQTRAKTAQKDVPPRGENPQHTALYGNHPRRIPGEFVCPFCGSKDTWSRGGNRNGSMRRICKAEACGKTWTIKE